MLIFLYSKKYHFWIQDMRMPELKFIDPAFNINYDLVQQDKNEFLLHIDAGVVLGEKGELDARNTFKALCSENEIFTPEMILPAIKKSITNARTALRTEMRMYETDCPSVARTSKATWVALSEGLINLYNQRGRLTDEDPEKNREFVSIDPDWQTQFLVSLTMQIIYNMISRGYPFKPEENHRFFTQYVPEPLWKRIYFKCNENTGGRFKFTLKELLMLNYCIDCAAQCMAGKTFEKLKTAIYDLNFEMRGRNVEAERKSFLQLAQSFMENLKSTLFDAGINISDFTTPIHWDEQIVTF